MISKPLLTILTILFTCICGCSPTSQKDYQIQAMSVIQRFTKELKKIKDPHSLVNKEKQLKKYFNQLVGVMIEYRAFIEKHPELSHEENLRLRDASLALKSELYRIYLLDGAQQIIEMSQKEAYNKLALFEQSLTNDRINLFEHQKPLSTPNGAVK